MTTYIYHAKDNKIVERATMQEPQRSPEYYSALSFAQEVKADESLSRYINHISLLKSYTCHPSCKDVWKDGHEVKESEFELKPCTCKIGTDCLQHYGKWFSPCTLAYSLITQQESEDELWQEVKETFDAIFNERYTVSHKLFLKLKQDYSLTRKQQ